MDLTGQARRLREGAIPSVFPDYPSCLQKYPKSRRRPPNSGSTPIVCETITEKVTQQTDTDNSIVLQSPRKRKLMLHLQDKTAELCKAHKRIKLLKQRVRIQEWNNSCDTDTTTPAQEKDPLSDDVAAHFCFQEVKVKHNESETVSVQMKAQVDVNKEKDPLSETQELDSILQVKLEPCWLPTEASSACHEFKDGDFASVNSPRSWTEEIYGVDSIWSSAELKRSYSYGESDDTKITGECQDEWDIYSKAAVLGKRGRSHQCVICGKRFTRLSHLKLHNLIHEGQKPHKCEVCDKRFTLLSNLKRHKLIHDGQKPHRCEICDKRFNDLGNLKRHTVVHKGIKAHKCQTCGKSFTLLSNLKVHHLKHEGKRPHKCESCDKRFTRLADLRCHSLMHTGIRPHKCQVCPKTFTLLSSLKCHNLIHVGKKIHKCDICGRGFTQLGNMKRHRLRHASSSF